MLGQDQDQGIPRLRSFSGLGAADELSSKAAKKKSKREPSPLSRMGSSLLRPFKGLSKLRTSRSSDRDGKLQGQSRAASHTESLASRATSTSTQDAAGPSRFNSASLQNPNLQTGKSALEPSDSFRFRRTGTEDAPDLSAEPSFAQDLPQNSRSVQAGSSSRVQAPLLSSRSALLTASAGSVRPGQPPSLSNNELQKKASGAAADAAADSDDEFDYDSSQPAAPHRSTAAPRSAALLQPNVVSTSSLQAEGTTARAGGGLQAQGNTDIYKGEGSLTLTADTASQQKPSGFSIEPGKFRPQRSRAEKPQLAAVAASVYSPLQSGATTSPTMRGSTGGGNSRDDAHGTQDQAELVLREGRPPAAGGQTGSNDQQVVPQHGSGEAEKGSRAQAPTAKDAQPQAGALSRQGNSRDAQGISDRQDGPPSPAVQSSGSHQGSLHGALTGQGFLDEGDDSASPSVSIASSAASSEFDILEALPDQSSQLQPSSTASLPASPLQPQAEQHTVQRSAYSDTPILGPSTSKYGQPGSAISAASAGGQGSSAMLSYRGLLQDGAQQAQLQSSALPLSPSPGLLAAADPLPATPRRGFSDKPILAVYSRRPSADEEATQAEDSGSHMAPSDPVLQTKVSTLLDCSNSIRLQHSVASICAIGICIAVPNAIVVRSMWVHVCQQCTGLLLCTKWMSSESQ